MKLLVRVPTRAEVHGGLLTWTAWAARQWPDADFSITYTRGYGTAWGRNRIVEEFMSSDCTHLCQIDADTLPPLNTSLVEMAAQYPVVVGPYHGWMGDLGLAWHLYHKEPAGGYRTVRPCQWPAERAFHVDRAALGYSIIERSVLERLGPDPFQHAHFDTLCPTGEDFEFCERVGGVMAVPEATCQHIRAVDLCEVEAWMQRLMQRLAQKLEKV